jgi:hypothetical protein
MYKAEVEVVARIQGEPVSSELSTESGSYENHVRCAAECLGVISKVSFR